MSRRVVSGMSRPNRGVRALAGSTGAGFPESLKREALRRGRRRGAAGGVVFTTIQKFAETQREDAEAPRRNAEQEQEFPAPLRPDALALNPVSERANVVVMADARMGSVMRGWGQCADGVRARMGSEPVRPGAFSSPTIARWGVKAH